MVPGESTRPVPDRVKEALFNILGNDIEGTAFWDVFAGTGSVGIEALSRGAGRAYFTDNDRVAIKTIRENLEATHLSGFAEVEQANAFNLLSQPGRQQFDYAYIAPPQYKNLWVRAIEALDLNTSWLFPDAWIIVQIDPRENEQLDLKQLERFDERTYGSSMLVFYEWTSD
jgi:16S rRNA (guanine966-N2)-methyltransferase